MTRVCVGGATGWTGSAVTRGVLASGDLELVAAVARSSTGQRVAAAVGSEAPTDVRIVATPAEAFESAPEVWIDFTHPSVVKAHALAALGAGVAVVIGTSGLAADDYAEIDRAAREAGRGVIAAGNFSITAALLKHFSGIAARHVPHWEIIDYAYGGKPDAPSGTVRELAEYLGGVSENRPGVPVEETLGDRATRGATMGGAQVHSIRLPGYVIGVEALFGLPDERLSIRHDAGSGAEPYVGGTLLAVRRVAEVTGLVRGLDTLMFAE